MKQSVNEDILTIISVDEKAKYHLDVTSQQKLGCPSNLDDIVKTTKDKYGNVLMIKVIAEDPMSGRVLRYEFNKWEEIGYTKGYA